MNTKTQATNIPDECDCCTNPGPFVKFMSMKMCMECYNKQKEHMSPAKQQERMDTVTNRRLIDEKVDETLKVRTDIFNASTASILELKTRIENDETITNKPYAFAEELKNRFNHYKQVIFKAQEEMIDATSNQRAIQSYLNQVSNQLRASEREQLKLNDMAYQPKPVKPVSSGPDSKTVKPRKPRFDKDELNKAARETGLNAATIQMLCVSKGLTVDDAVKQLKAMIAASQQEQAGK